MKKIVIIPAREDSKRLPGKLLLEVAGKPLIAHTYLNAAQFAKAGLIDALYVASNSERIAGIVTALGGQVIMTGACDNGTERVAEAATKIAGEDTDLFINIQGDEPAFSEQNLCALIDAFSDGSALDIATLAIRIAYEEALNPNAVKVVLDNAGYAMYFSRAPIPYPRDAQADNFVNGTSDKTTRAKPLKKGLMAEGSLRSEGEEDEGSQKNKKKSHLESVQHLKQNTNSYDEEVKKPLSIDAKKARVGDSRSDFRGDFTQTTRSRLANNLTNDAKIREDDTTDVTPPHLRHIGVYAYSRKFLLELPSITPSPLERIEKIEQLRFLAASKRVRVALTHSAGIDINTRADLDTFGKYLAVNS